MNELVTGQSALTMSSREIAELVDSRHDNVRRAIERLSNQNVIQLPPMEEVKNHLGQSISEYVFSGERGKRDSIVVVAQLCPGFTARLVDRWQELEEQAHRYFFSMVRRSISRFSSSFMRLSIIFSTSACGISGGTKAP